LLQAKAWPLIYAFILSVVCAMVLGAINAGLTQRIDLNRTNERRLIVLHLFGVDLEDNSPAGIEKAYTSMVASHTVQDPDNPTNEIEYFTFTKDGKVDAIAFQVAGVGLWSRIHGYVAVEAPDFTTIRNVNFDQQEETPGLGGEIVSEWFRAQFVGKSILHDGKPIARMVAKPGQAADYQVDGISGATITSGAVSTMFARGFADAVHIAEAIRKEQAG